MSLIVKRKINTLTTNGNIEEFKVERKQIINMVEKIK